jgi:hypothetical protein
MKTSKLTFAAMFVATLAWTGVAKAEDPCGAPGELLKSCEVVEKPECHRVCEPDGMLISCIADAAAACMIECENAKSASCEAGCAGQCKAECAENVIPDGPQDCEISCGSECMGGCGAACQKSDDKTTCFAACNQQCSAHCSVSCDGGGDKPEPGGDDDDGNLECEVACTQACTGSCMAEGARDCEISCQIAAAAECKAKLPDKCHQVCDNGGILACDEQFIDIDDVDACLAELEQLGVEVRGNIDALRGGQMVLNGRSQASCSVEDQAKLGLAGALCMVLSFGLGATFLRRRR